MEISILDALSAALSTVGGASILAAILPRSPRFAWAFKLLDILAANWMQARNAGPSPAAELDAAIARARASIAPRS